MDSCLTSSHFHQTRTRPRRLLTCSVFDYLRFDARRCVSQPSAPREPQHQEPCAKITRCSFRHTRLLFQHFLSETRLSSLILWENIFVRQSNAVAYQEACDSHSELFTPGLAGQARSPMLTAGSRHYSLPGLGFGLLSSEIPPSPPHCPFRF